MGNFGPVKSICSGLLWRSDYWCIFKDFFVNSWDFLRILVFSLLYSAVPDCIFNPQIPRKSDFHDFWCKSANTRTNERRLECVWSTMRLFVTKSGTSALWSGLKITSFWLFDRVVTVYARDFKMHKSLVQWHKLNLLSHCPSKEHSRDTNFPWADGQKSWGRACLDWIDQLLHEPCGFRSESLVVLVEEAPISCISAPSCPDIPLMVSENELNSLNLWWEALWFEFTNFAAKKKSWLRTKWLRWIGTNRHDTLRVRLPSVKRNVLLFVLLYSEVVLFVNSWTSRTFQMLFW